MEEALQFMTLAASRYSVRQFSNRKPEAETIERILAAGNLAPTACNRQPQRIRVIQSEADLQKLKRCTTSHFNAPAALLVCCDTDACWQRPYDDKLSGEIDASIVTTHMMLAAHAQGVGTTWVMHFIPEAIRTEFELPDHYLPIALLVMGYPAADAKPYPAHAERKPLSDIVF